MKKVRVFIVPNYGNDDILIDSIKEFDGIKSNCKLRRGPFSGCNVPQVLDLQYESKEILKKFHDSFDKIAQDDWWIERYDDIIKNSS